MYRPRIIPVLLLQNQYLVKSVNFKKYDYIGDPINAVKIFNDLKADELVFLDIEASEKNSNVEIDFVQHISEEANMPFSIGGGIKTIEQIRKIINSGAERVIIGSKALEDPLFVQRASETFGSSTISVCIDYRKSLFTGLKVFYKNGKISSPYSPLDFAKLMESYGAGEIIVQSIDRDGRMEGYDLDLLRKISQSVSIPITALGGASGYEDFQKCYQTTLVNGLASGSVFVYQNKNKGVLINYPENKRKTLNLI